MKTEVVKERQMANEPVDLILPVLREMREMRGEIQGMKQQLDKLESGQKTIRQALTPIP